MSDAKEWQSFLDTGAITVIPPKEARKIDPARIFKRPARKVLTNKSTSNETLEAKTRMVLPGDVDPDGDLPIE